MGVDANEVGGEEDGGNLIIICEVEFHDGAVIGDRRWGCDFVTLDLGEGWQITFYETLVCTRSCERVVVGPGGMIVLHSGVTATRECLVWPCESTWHNIWRETSIHTTRSTWNP